jgi:hypothetical protein
MEVELYESLAIVSLFEGMDQLSIQSYKYP